MVVALNETNHPYVGEFTFDIFHSERDIITLMGINSYPRYSFAFHAETQL